MYSSSGCVLDEKHFQRKSVCSNATLEGYNYNSDLMVDCGTTVITLEINMCTAQWAGFNTSDLALNGNHNTTACLGSIDTSVDPLTTFHFCQIMFTLIQIVDEAPDPTGPFSSFLSIQSVIITGYIDTPRSEQGLISYSTDLYYHFSCRYPLEYLINNTQIVAKVSMTFVEAWLLIVNCDSLAQCLVPSFHVLLDHCFATPTAYNTSQTEQYNFFTGCSVEQKTSVTSNGFSTAAQFNFEAFRFVQHRDQSKSSIYVHCILRLCEPSKCQELSLAPFGDESAESATLTVGPIYTSNQG
uniref:ZP domain-containing protein n=1 Tax=Mola mola TaxID=94237 RepID=A0A3Q3WLP3_MOLML